MTETYRDPPISVDQLEALFTEFEPQFSEPLRLRQSWDSLKAWCLEKRLPITEAGARRWFDRDLERDRVLSFRYAGADADPLAEAHPSSFEASAATLDAAIASGDVHDFRQDLPVDQHEVICPRCQLGIQSRLRADERAQTLGKQPFPSFGRVLERVAMHDKARA